MEARTGSAYEAVREQARTLAAAAAAVRRVALGEFTLVFLNREMVQSALEEELRAEAVADPETVAASASAFGARTSGGGRLQAILFANRTDPAQLTDLLNRWQGVEQRVILRIGDDRITGQPEGELAAATPLRFDLTDSQVQAWRGVTIRVAIDDPRCPAEAELDAAQTGALAEDLS